MSSPAVQPRRSGMRDAPPRRPGPLERAVRRSARGAHAVVTRHRVLWAPAGRVSRFVATSPRLGPVRRALTPLRDLLRGSMRSEDVHMVLDALDARGVPYWIAGGWGVDALLARQTRSHDDLDVVIGSYSEHLAQAIQALAALGYEFTEAFERRAWMPRAVVLEDATGHRVDLVSMGWEMLESAFSAQEPTRQELERMAFGTGTIGERRVPCLSGPVQLLYHSRFELTEEHQRDMALLRRELGVS